MTIPRIACLVLFVSSVSGPAGAASNFEAIRIAGLVTKAHGDNRVWREAPTVTFVDEWDSSKQPSRVTVEQGRRRAYIDMLGTDQRLTWDGERAWSENWKSPTPPRFLALLNYYFTNLPWLVQDPGVNLGKPESARLWEDPTEYITILMTFGEGVGDTPDDYYKLYIHPETYELKGCGYIVTYRSLLPEGVKSTPEHTLIYDSWTTVSGLKVPTAFTIYNADHTVYAKCSFKDWSFSMPFDESRMTMPGGAVVDETEP